MREACTLKVREYLRAGLPVYAAHDDVAGLPWFKKGPATLAAALDYADEVRAVDRATVAEDARPFIDKARLLEQLYGELSARFA